ncbi:hypothetical protein KY331_04570 [Candidatus Woesearchaeota archaeon]|nr:hypothetical protein [Candidatus Woesearchaeota archaeon]
MVDVKNLKEGTYVIHENEPCIIKSIEFLPNISNPIIKLEIEGIFSAKSYEKQLSMHDQLEEADLARKCATVVSKKENKIEIMDMATFETLNAEISKELLDKAEQGDNITYISFGNAIKVIEVRK